MKRRCFLQHAGALAGTAALGQFGVLATHAARAASQVAVNLDELAPRATHDIVDAIAEQESTIRHRDCGLLRIHILAIQVYAHTLFRAPVPRCIFGNYASSNVRNSDQWPAWRLPLDSGRRRNRDRGRRMWASLADFDDPGPCCAP